MKKPQFTTILFIFIFVSAGFGYYIWNRLGMEMNNSEIQTGQVHIDYSDLEKLQEEVDKGDQPWRLDPLLVARTEVQKY